jgi:hypothetical protein
MSGMCTWRWVLLILLTVLLPLRGAMALSMGLADADTLPRTTAMTSAEEAPCPHHAASHKPLESPHNSAHDTHHGQSQAHLLCDLCNVPALGQQVHCAPGTQALPIGVPHRSEHFASVVLPIGHKPPIPA